VKYLLTLCLIYSLAGCATTSAPNTLESESIAIAYTVSGAKGMRPVLRGNRSKARVSIISFSDFECPYCSKADATLKELVTLYGDRLQLVFMHNPLAFHKLALPASMLAAAADAQGKFWTVHDMLFEAKAELNGEVFDSIVTRTGLDMEKLQADFENPDLLLYVKRSQAVAAAVGVQGTPAFFVNGVLLEGAQPLEVFKAIIDKELALAKGAGREGVSWIKERQAANKPELNDYLYAGKVPPDLPNQVPEEPQAPVLDDTVFKVTVNSNDAQLGEREAPVSLVVFSEFECPFCAKIKPTLKALQKEFGASLRIVFKHNPLAFHENARSASEAALCAKDQGGFWKMHDWLFDHQDTLDEASLLASTETLGLDEKQFAACMADDAHTAQIDDDLELAASVGSRGTPNSFVNGRLIQGAQPVSVFKALIQEELTKAEALKKEGILPANLYAHIIKGGKQFPDLGDTAHDFSMTDAPVQGDWTHAPMKITVFSDFQCPYCSKVAPILEAVRARLGWKVALTFKHFPLSFHELAMPASKATICAQRQGKFWSYHDAIFESQESWTPSVFTDTAAALGLDMNSFKACLKDDVALTKIIERDMQEGEDAGVTGTPSIYVNGRKADLGSGLSVATLLALAKGRLKDTVAKAEQRAPRNACRAWLTCLGALAQVDKKGIKQLQSVAKTLENQVRRGDRGVLAACRAGMEASLESFPGISPDVCR
jgi:protein-disulfide isomerase